MLGRLLKSLWSRPSRRAPVANPAASTPLPGELQSSAPGHRGVGQHSRIAVLSRLASVVADQGVQVTGKEAPVELGARGARTEIPILLVLARCHEMQAAELQPSTAERVESFTPRFVRAPVPDALNVFVFHVDLPVNENIDYVDVRFRPADFDYQQILATFIARLRAHVERPVVHVVTSVGAPYRSLAAPDVHVVELSIDGSQPMYDRATALLAYARSEAFDADTVCLDSDVLVNRPLAGLFELGFDLAVTYRNVERLMPVNEGALFLRAERKHAVASFLERRLATYDRIAADEMIRGYYGNVKRWRGGQLSLNAMVYGALPCSPYRMLEAHGARLRFLPCDTFNFAAAEGEAASSLDRLHECYLIHYKGWRKHAFGFAARARGQPPRPAG